MKLVRRLWFLLTRSRRDAELREEMRLHLELRAAANARRGLPPPEAARQARVRFGNPVRLREDSRDTWGFVMVEQTLKDFVYAARQLWRRPTWTMTVVLTLALGVGANNAVFTLIDALLLRPGVGDQPDRLVWIATVLHPSGGLTNVSYPDYVAYRDRAKTVAGVMAFSGAEFSVGGQTADRVYGDVATGNYFDVLRIPAALGRTLTADDDRPGAAPVVVLSDGLWRAHFAADGQIIGQTVTLNGMPFTVAGVAPAGFTGAELGKNVELWVTMALEPTGRLGYSRGLLTEADSRWLRVMARLRDGASIDRANADMNVIAASLGPTARAADRRPTALVASTTGGLHPANRNGLALVLGLIGVVPVLVLLVACANVANVVMAQNVSRQREFAMRRAIGAPRARLLRLLLVEATVIGALAALAGLAASAILTAIVIRVGELPDEVTSVLQSSDRVIFVTVAMALAATAIYGLLPALAATRFDLVAAVKEHGGAIAGSVRQRRLRAIFVVTQIAVSLMLVIATGLFLRSLTKALQVDPGFVARGAISVTVDPGLQGYDPERRALLTRTLVERASNLPGVSAAGVTSLLPLSGMTRRRTVSSEDATRTVSALDASVSPEYFAAMQIPILAGRPFSREDRLGARPVVIVNETLARRLWPGESALGHRLADQWDPAARLEIIGVARDGKYSSLNEEPESATYVPVAQRQGIGAPLSVVVRSAGDETLLLRNVVAVVRSIDPDLPPYRAEPLADTVHAAAEDRRAAAALVGVLGLMAFAIAAIGIYGVAAHSVSLRRREVGIRVAVGASPADVRRLFVRQTLGLALIGVGVGTAASVAASSLLSSYLFGLTSTDVVTFVGAAVGVCAVSLAATYIPARQASRLNPVVALKSE